KNAVGKSLAEKTGLCFLDADKLIEEKAGMPIAQIFKRFGEPHFRQLETAVLKEICAKNNCVIATGGGAPVKKENAAAMRKNSIIVLLRCSPQIIFKRIKGDASRPPLTKLPDELQEIKFMLKQRNPVYRSLADFVTDAGKKSVEENVSEIIGFLKKKGLLGEAQ
ncbi:MAG: shikimate kinase, partial [Candidatus Diapherotrites archaeon]|nr:shikimate kinase [Candidatus Diapherotrites archaeon]